MIYVRHISDSNHRDLILLRSSQNPLFQPLSSFKRHAQQLLFAILFLLSHIINFTSINT